jgi:hypothetical protein
VEVVKFLESLGREPSFDHDRYQAAIDTLDVGEAERESLRGRDAGKLAELLGGRAKMWCAVMAPDRAPAEEDEPSLPDQEPDQEA